MLTFSYVARRVICYFAFLGALGDIEHQEQVLNHIQYYGMKQKDIIELVHEVSDRRCSWYGMGSISK